ncbi:MAG: hypothetical protein Fur0037_10030 [Planctomycetota bacterium]
MRRFRFPLQAVLRLREHALGEAVRDLALATKREAAVESKLDNVATGLRDCEDHGRGSGATALLARALESGLRRYRWRLLQEKRKVDEAVERARAAYLERRAAVSAMERLREKSREDWRISVESEERKEQDELARLARAAVERAEAES